MSDKDWTPVPKDQRFVVLRFNRRTADWNECEFTELRPGDVFRMFTPDGEHPVDPSADEIATWPNIAMLCEETPYRSPVRGYWCSMSPIFLPELIVH